jgi:FLVCR family MFS transporter 7
LGNAFRLLGSAEFLSAQWRFYIAIVGQILAGSAQPFIMYLPTKLASFWFAESERVIANTLGSMSNPIGVATAYSLGPLVVNGTHSRAFLLLNGIVSAVACVGALLSLGVTSSHPPIAPSSSSSQMNNGTLSLREFYANVKSALSSGPFLVLFFALGSGVGLFNAVYNNLQPALCVKGYSNAFAASMGSLMIVCGLIGSALFGIFVDKTRLFEETMKICLCIASVAASSLLVALQYESQQWWIALSIGAFGAFGFAIYPIGLEIGVETTFPVPEATSTGLLIIMGQVLGVIYVVLTSLLTTSATAHEMSVQTCISPGTPGQSGTNVTDWKYGFIAWTSIVAVTAVAFTGAFWPKYKRLQYETEASARRITERVATDNG